MQNIELNQELYSLKDSVDIISKLFKGWTNKYKLREIFKYHSEYEVIKQGEGQRTRYYIKREKLQQLIGDIEKGKLN